MGRPRKSLDMQKGNLTVVTRERRESEERKARTGKEQLKRPPAWLINDEAKKEWRRITKELKEIELVGNLDRNNLGGYCNAFANYLQVTELLKGQEYYLERETRTGTIIVKNPLVDIQKSYAEEMRRFAAMCGLTIDSRLKAVAAKADAEEQELKARFGI